jgi:hypothetical protein
MAVHVSILETSLICLFGCMEAPLDIGALCAWPYSFSMVGR